MPGIVTYVNVGFANDFIPRWGSCLRYPLYDHHSPDTGVPASGDHAKQ